jgi:hypothetical protein
MEASSCHVDRKPIAADLLFGERGEEAFDLVEPTARVRVKWTWKRGWRTIQRWMAAVLWVA